MSSLQTSPETNHLFTALAKAQAELKPVFRNKTVNLGKFTYAYADLDGVLGACRSALNSHGLTVIQSPEVEGSKVTLATLIGHTSGQWVRGEISLVAKGSDPQSIGSAITYARRYSLSAFVGLAPDDDDDGATASAPKHHEDRPAKPDLANCPINLEEARKWLHASKDLATLESRVSKLNEDPRMTDMLFEEISQAANSRRSQLAT